LPNPVVIRKAAGAIATTSAFALLGLFGYGFFAEKPLGDLASPQALFDGAGNAAKSAGDELSDLPRLASKCASVSPWACSAAASALAGAKEIMHEAANFIDSKSRGLGDLAKAADEAARTGKSQVKR
jgi:hypothetical protein